MSKAWSKHETEAVLPKYKFSHLKFVELQDFRGFKNEVNMIKFLLENAIVLEKLINRVRKDSNRSSKKKQKLMNLGNKLLTFPRASACVRILYVQNW
ncbi:hypothetical protein FRX31_020065 [Thalictrum thalictroides]|uniref:FBD domain-containing protein n=1 Tax=Thalictrum thalictroides TaxID=46969 RepID=A0A7J6VZ02_THATH|nr:hypothetical protein FRX31_020065 [Thalictrum thalictroides]